MLTWFSHSAGNLKELLSEQLAVISESGLDPEHLERSAKQILSKVQRDLFVTVDSIDRRLRKIQSDFRETLKDMVHMGLYK